MIKRSVPIFIITALFVLIGYVLVLLPPTRSLDSSFSDILIRYFTPSTKISDDIVLVVLDEATMKGLPYRSPVPRDFLYQLNEKILAAEPRIVGYDIFFKDPTIAINDQKLATSFKKGNVFAVSAGKKDESGKDIEDLPMEIFLRSFKGFGLADLPFSSSDTTVRDAQFEFNFNGILHQSFVAKLYNSATGGRAEALIHDPENILSIEGIHFSPFDDTIEPSKHRTRIRFSGFPSPIKRFPASVVVKGLIPSDWLKNKIILVGAAYDDGTDAYITPYYSSRYNYERMNGVEIHANILNQLLTKQFYYHVPRNILLVTLTLLGFVASFLFLKGSIWRGVISVSGFVILVIFSAIFIFNRTGLIIPTIPLEGSILISFGICLGLRSVTEGKQKRFIKSVFAKYVPPAVVDKMIANPTLLTLGGEEREITCLFTDIAGFTTISEKLDPQTLVKFLNEYLDKLTRIIFKHGGTLDKYEGDAIIAFFGAPVKLQNHREAALLAGIEMQKASHEISSIWKELCGREITTRIGINSGNAVVGNMGSDLRFDYTAIGDTMNLASRLEGANKFFNTQILASEAVIKTSNTVAFRPVANVKVKGKTAIIKIYEVLGLKSEIKETNWPEPTEIIELTSK